MKFTKYIVNVAIDVLSFFIGPICLFFLEVAQRYSNKRYLGRCNIVGRRVTIGSSLQICNTGFISINDDVSLLHRVLLVCDDGGEIKIGKNCFLGNSVTISAGVAKIWIDEDCLIAEQVSILAVNHGTKADTLIRLQENIARDIWIGKDVWIGKGVTVLPGAFIADGCVIGANSVVRGTTEPYTIYAGAPIRKIKLRER